MESVKEFVNRRFKGNEPWQICLKTLAATGAVYYGTQAWEEIQEKGFGEYALDVAKGLPFVQDILNKELEKEKKSAGKMVFSCPEVLEYKLNETLPEEGVSKENLLKDLLVWQQLERKRFNKGQCSGTVYHGELELANFLGKVYTMFCLSNPLHPSTFPFVQKMEAEVVSMTLKMFRGLSSEHCGVTTSGGTESILMAMKAYKERGKARGIHKPEIIACVTAHAAFDKAADYFGLKLVHIAADPNTFELDIKKAKRAINRNTIALVCSAPSYAQGIIDNVEEAAAVVKEMKQENGWDIGIHVDCCLGGFLAPFVRQMPGRTVKPFDFSVEGVTSISADTHKYGFSPKGTSVLMFANKKLRQFMYFTAPKWTGGIYATPTMPGSRSGGVVAATWAVMMHQGKKGYMDASSEIMKTADYIKSNMSNIPGLKVMGNPELSVVGIESTDPKLNIYAVNAAMTAKHWELNALQNPACIHICCTYCHRDKGEKFMTDLADSVRDVRENAEAYAKKSSVVIYGTTQTVPGSLVGEISKGFIDALFTLPQKEEEKKEESA